MSEIFKQHENCEKVRGQFALLLYGELSFDEEERVESHLDGCAECRTALQRQKALHDALDGVAVTPSPALLTRCREDLTQLLGHEKPDSRTPSCGKQLTSSWNVQFLRPMTAMALLAVGFFAGESDARLELRGRRSFHGARKFWRCAGAQCGYRNQTARLRIVVNETRGTYDFGEAVTIGRSGNC